MLKNKTISPLRIVSVVPSQTELLYTLGLNNEVVGITKFCVHPNSWYKNKTRVGGTKTLDIEQIKKLNPTLILANKEENVKEQIEALRDVCPVYVSDINTFDDALMMMDVIGQWTNRHEMARELIEQLRFQATQYLQKPDPRSVLYLIWQKPYMAAGTNTFIHTMLKVGGWKNSVPLSRYPELTEEQIRTLNPGLVFLSSEPFPFKQKHIQELQTILPEAKIMLVDGEMFSWYGSRLLHSFNYFKTLHEKLDIT
jgi:ABC-type Fe3+-hydroxamate transport system substrate-binding protein